MKKQALANISGDWFTLDDDMLQEGLEASRQSPRQRMILPVHRYQESPVQRMLNFLQPETYIRPHMHPRDGAVESICVLQGSLRFFVFDETGTVKFDTFLEASGVIDIEPRVWHNFVVLSTDTIIFETKMGPYDAEMDKEFAMWAPGENSDEAKAWVEQLKSY